MRRGVATLILALACLVAAQPASAHRLRVLATVEDDTVTGYGFFVGGGRPQGATVIMRDGDGKDLWRGATDNDGRFSWRPDKPIPLTVIVDARDGHVAEAKIAADRFAGAPSGAAETGAVPAAMPTQSGVGAPLAGNCVGDVDAAALNAMVERAAGNAVERQMRPLLEAYQEAQGAIRFNDLMGGIGMIIGLAGIGMWAASRRRKPSGSES